MYLLVAVISFAILHTYKSNRGYVCMYRLATSKPKRMLLTCTNFEDPLFFVPVQMKSIGLTRPLLAGHQGMKFTLFVLLFSQNNLAWNGGRSVTTQEGHLMWWKISHDDQSLYL